MNKKNDDVFFFYQRQCTKQLQFHYKMIWQTLLLCFGESNNENFLITLDKKMHTCHRRYNDKLFLYSCKYAYAILNNIYWWCITCSMNNTTAISEFTAHQDEWILSRQIRLYNEGACFSDQRSLPISYSASDVTPNVQPLSLHALALLSCQQDTLYNKGIEKYWTDCINWKTFFYSLSGYASAAVLARLQCVSWSMNS